ncbi:hypothetical protein GE061_009166 [Apolygus lucorum]|uniref:H15 domain-containing protein n=1 Tax=Apolygus lucorum TaxID=248454 RepID=A0A8S9XZS7_APOLU|nr:hypothetical protein GE061_009166 [Apolygus lucorum]
MSFAVRNSQVNVAARLLWTCKDIEYFGKPFQVLKRTKLECKYGMIRKPADENSAKFNHSFGKKKRNKPSKKTGCPAVMKITEIILYPEFAIDTSIEKNVANVERMKMKELRQTLDTTADVPTEKRYFITVSKPSDHNHSVWISPLTQPLKPQLKTPKKKKVKAKETVPRELWLSTFISYLSSRYKHCKTMTETTASAPKAKSPKKAGGNAKTKPSHPPSATMVNAAIRTLKERGGSSLQAIKKYISSTYKVDAEKLAPFIRKYIKGAVTSGELVQTKGSGASGSFKLSGGMKKAVKPKAAKKEKKQPSKAKKAKKPPTAPKAPKPKKKAAKKK